MTTPSNLLFKSTPRELWLMRHVRYAAWAADARNHGDNDVARYFAKQARFCLITAYND